MSSYEPRLPQLLPVLSRGKHRNPRKGACFMELASYLAGERWSDHPACTHPLLAAVARMVNDCTSDAGRPRLAGLIPSVIGTTSDDLQVDARIALVCETTALPLVAEERQRVLAVSVLTCQSVLTGRAGTASGDAGERSRSAFAQVPLAAAWAQRFARGAGRSRTMSAKDFRRHAAPHTVSYAVEGIAKACIPAPDDVLHDLLVDAIAQCAPPADLRPRNEVDAEAWADACRLTGTVRTS